MTSLREIYRCQRCGNIVEVLHAGEGTIVCCGEPMTLQKENTTEASLEKHLPDLRQEGDRLFVQIGSVQHPMIPEHYIEWIEVEQNDKIQRRSLRPEEDPDAVFSINPDQPYSVRAWCNLHGLWKKDRL